MIATHDVVRRPGHLGLTSRKGWDGIDRSVVDSVPVF